MIHDDILRRRVCNPFYYQLEEISVDPPRHSDIDGGCRIGYLARPLQSKDLAGGPEQLKLRPVEELKKLPLAVEPERVD